MQWERRAGRQPNNGPARCQLSNQNEVEAPSPMPTVVKAPVDGIELLQHAPDYFDNGNFIQSSYRADTTALRKPSLCITTCTQPTRPRHTQKTKNTKFGSKRKQLRALEGQSRDYTPPSMLGENLPNRTLQPGRCVVTDRAGAEAMSSGPYQRRTQRAQGVSSPRTNLWINLSRRQTF